MIRQLRRVAPYALLTALLLAADQLSKAYARGLTAPRVLIPGVVQLRFVENTGVSFSLLQASPHAVLALTVIGLLLGAYLLRNELHSGLSRFAACLLLSGALGNLIDRLLRGRVTDFFETLFVRFAVFNAADAFLTVGCVLMLIALLQNERKPKEQRAQDDHGEKQA